MIKTVPPLCTVLTKIISLPNICQFMAFEPTFRRLPCSFDHSTEEISLSKKSSWLPVIKALPVNELRLDFNARSKHWPGISTFEILFIIPQHCDENQALNYGTLFLQMVLVAFELHNQNVKDWLDHFLNSVLYLLMQKYKKWPCMPNQNDEKDWGVISNADGALGLLTAYGSDTPKSGSQNPEFSESTQESHSKNQAKLQSTDAPVEDDSSGHEHETAEEDVIEPNGVAKSIIQKLMQFIQVCFPSMTPCPTQSCQLNQIGRLWPRQEVYDQCCTALPGELTQPSGNFASCW